MIELIVSRSAENRLKKGIQLLDKRDFPDVLPWDELVALRSESGQFLGTGYLSLQQKGVGWFLSPSSLLLTVDHFVSLFQRARQKRVVFEVSSHTTAYRLFNQDGDGFGGFTVDCYGDFALFSWYNRFVYSQKAMILAAFQQVFPDFKGAYEKIRFKGLTHESAHLYGTEAPETFTILEHGVAYSVFLNDGLMTGIFLDQHEIRGGLVDGLALGKRVLNTFSYTAAFSVAAAMGGAIETTSVDLAKRSIDLSKAHFEANQLDTSSHHFVVMDVFDYFKWAKKKGLRFDVIVIDPPSFAKNKKKTFSVLKDYHKLIEQALSILSSKGTIIASTNASNFSASAFKRELQKGLKGVHYDFCDFKQLPSDFSINPNDATSNYLKVFRIKIGQ